MAFSRERFVRAAAHEGKRARRCPADPAGDGRVEGEHARRGAGFMRLLRASLDIDGRAIDDERALWRRGKKIRMRRENMPARREHGYDRIGFERPPRVRSPQWRRLRAAARRLRRLDEIEALDRVASLDEVCGHRGVHIAEADEGDVRHGYPRTPGAVLVFKLGAEGGVIRAS